MKRDKNSKHSGSVSGGCDAITPPKDTRKKVLAKSAAQLCAVFGVDPDNLQGRPAADQTDARALAHNGLRKFAIGAIAHLAFEVEDAWAMRHGAEPKSARAVQIVPQLHGTHRSTLGAFHAQFLALCGMGDHNPKSASNMGKFVRSRYEEIRDAAISAIMV